MALTEKEVLDLYVDIMRNIYGQKTTIETIENIGRIETKRHLEDTA